MHKKTIVSVIGGNKCDSKVEEICIELGKLLGKVGAIVVCGGLGGVMMAVAKGVKMSGGLTVGILPGGEKEAANPYIDIPIATGLGYARNTIVAGCADVVIALAGEYGTLSEIAFALNMKKPVISLGSWEIHGVRQAASPQEVLEILESIKSS